MRKPLPTHLRILIGAAFIMAVAMMAIGCERTARKAHAAWERGVKCYNRLDYQCAIKECGRAVKLEPDNAQYRVNLAYALMGAKMYEQAAAEFQSAIRIDPSNVEARRHLARLMR